MKKRVVITGVGAVSPLAIGAEESFQAAVAGKSGVAPITRIDASAFAAKIAGEVKDFDATTWIEKKEHKKMDLFSQYAIAAGVEAWENSGLHEKLAYAPEKIGCLLGIGMGGLPMLERYHQAWLEGGARKISPFLIPGMITNLGPGNLAIRLGIKGVNYTVTSACTSATHAIGEAYRYIRDGILDSVVTGGSESSVSALGIGGFCAMKALSTRNDEPEKASRPFDRDRDGFVLAEGAAVFVLEELEAAKSRGANIIAEVAGYGASCDAFHITAPSEDGAGAMQSMQLALEDSGLAPTDISYVNAHGTSTQANDITETKAIKQVFGDWATGGLRVSSTKSATGHLLGAAGAIEALFSIFAIRDSVIPPTINLDNPDEGCDLDYCPHEAVKQPVTAALSNSFGFGGTNGTLIFKQVGA